MTRRHRVTLATIALLVGPTLLGGCSVKTGSSRPDNPVADRALDDDVLRVDLSDGLTREEVGMPAGRSTFSIGHTGGRPLIAVTVDLPEGGVLEREVSDVTFSPVDITDTDAAPTIVDLSRRSLTLDAARALLDRSVEDLGLDARAIATWATDAAAADPDAPYATTVFDGPDIGPIRVEVEVAQFAEDQEYGVRTILTLSP